MNKKTAFSVNRKLSQNMVFLTGSNDINAPLVNEFLLVAKD
ncbi:MAG: hypothetical protein WAS56_15730 [Saprospiraceae bacterium]|jgi:hypothetical protein